MGWRLSSQRWPKLTAISTPYAIKRLNSGRSFSCCVGFILGNPVSGWLGKRSYGIYLWHWPIVVLTGRGSDVRLDGLGLFAVRAGATVGIAALSYRFVEWPVRHGAIQRAWQRPRAGRRPRRRWL